MELFLTLLALFVYPGLLLAVGLGALYRVLRTDAALGDSLAAFRQTIMRPAWNSTEGYVQAVSIVLAACGLALLPWPWHPAPDMVVWLWAWGALEAAFLLPLLPALLVSSPPIVRAAMRAAQMGVLGRAMLWVGLAVGLLLHTNWQLIGPDGQWPVLAHALALLTAILAFPVAIGWGPFAPETSITPAGAEDGLNGATMEFVRAAEDIRVAALLAASLVSLLPVGILPAPLALVLILVVFGAVSVGLKRLTGRFVRLTLPAALQLCLWRTLPLGIAAVIALGLVAGS